MLTRSPVCNSLNRGFQGSGECHGQRGDAVQANLQGFHDVVPSLGGAVPALDLARGHAFAQFCQDEFARVAFRFLLPQDRVEVIPELLTYDALKCPLFLSR